MLFHANLRVLLLFDCRSRSRQPLFYRGTLWPITTQDSNAHCQVVKFWYKTFPQSSNSCISSSIWERFVGLLFKKIQSPERYFKGKRVFLTACCLQIRKFSVPARALRQTAGTSNQYPASIRLTTLQAFVH